MANQLLFTSAAVMTLIHSIVMWTHPRVDLLYAFLLMHGCFTSLINHGSTNMITRLYDRVTMGGAIFVDIYFMVEVRPMPIAVWAFVASIVFYFIGKHFTSRLFHMIAHLLITSTHVMIIIAF